MILTIDMIEILLRSPITDQNIILEIEKFFCSKDHSLLNLKFFVNKQNKLITPIKYLLYNPNDYLLANYEYRELFYKNHKNYPHITFHFNLINNYAMIFNLTTSQSLNIGENIYENFLLGTLKTTNLYVTHPFIINQEIFSQLTFHTSNFNSYSKKIQNDYESPENLIRVITQAAKLILEKHTINHIELIEKQIENMTFYDFNLIKNNTDITNTILQKFKNDLNIKGRLEILENLKNGNWEYIELSDTYKKLKNEKN